MKSWVMLACVVLLIGVAAAQGVTVHMVGDSTMANKSNPETNPEFGWGQVLQDYFDANQVTGSLPAELGNLSNLTNLFLFENQLTGSIPSELGNLGNLQYLALSNNQLSGSI